MLSTQFNRDNQYQAITKPSLLAGCIALALLPSAAFAAPATEETVIVEGSATAPDDGENDYSVTSTSAGTKMQMTQRDIPQSVTIVSQQRMEDQQLQTLGEVMENTLGISKSQADSDRALYYSRGFQIDNYMVDGIPTYFESRWNLGDAPECGSPGSLRTHGRVKQRSACPDTVPGESRRYYGQLNSDQNRHRRYPGQCGKIAMFLMVRLPDVFALFLG